MTAQSETRPLESVLVRSPRAAFGSRETIARSWRLLGYRGAPDLRRAEAEHDAFVRILADARVEVHFLESPGALGMDSLYPRDASVLCRDGAVLCRMGKEARSAEPEAHAEAFEQLNVPVLGAIGGDGRLEGGDVAWLDERTVAVGLGYRTNAEGIRQLRALLGERIDALIVVALPHWRGPGDVFHLMSMLSPLAARAALVYPRLLPVPFRRTLLELGFLLVEVPDEEFESMGCNALSLDPGRCVLLEGNPRTRRRIERCGIEVIEYAGREISLRGSGGPTCLTRPVSRRPTGAPEGGPASEGV